MRPSPGPDGISAYDGARAGARSGSVACGAAAVTAGRVRRAAARARRSAYAAIPAPTSTSIARRDTATSTTASTRNRRTA